MQAALTGMGWLKEDGLAHNGFFLEKNMEGTSVQKQQALSALKQDFASVTSNGLWNHVVRPERDALIAIVKQIRQLLFPQQLWTSSREPGYFDLFAEKLFVSISTQLRYALQFLPENEHRTWKKLLPEANQLTAQFLDRIPALRFDLMMDAQAAYENDPAAFNIEEIVLCYPGFFAITVYRIAHEFHKLKVPLIPRMLTEYAHAVTGIDIHPGAEIGREFFIDHGTGVVIGETTVIGNRVKIYQGVTLGAKVTHGGLRHTKRHPSIKDNVTIYSGASILGGDTVIGDGVTVGGNVFLTKSVDSSAGVVRKSL